MIDNDKLRTHTMELHSLMSIIWRSSMHEMERWIAEHDINLTRIQIGVLRFLHHEGDQTLSDLSRAFALDPSTLVPVVDTLEERAYVQRTRDPDDRRRMPITVTDEGRELVKSLPDLHTGRPLMDALQSLEEAEIEQLVSLLCRIAGEMPEASSPLQASKKRLIAQGAKEEHLICNQPPHEEAH